MSVTNKSDGLLLDGLSTTLFDSVGSLRAYVGKTRCLDSNSFSDMRTANSGSSHYVVLVLIVHTHTHILSLSLLKIG